MTRRKETLCVGRLAGRIAALRGFGNRLFHQRVVGGVKIKLPVSGPDDRPFRLAIA